MNWVNLNGITGEEVPLNDVKSYAKAIDKILNTSGLLQKYSNECKLRIRNNFTDQKSVNTARKILEDLFVTEQHD